MNLSRQARLILVLTCIGLSFFIGKNCTAPTTNTVALPLPATPENTASPTTTEETLVTIQPEALRLNTFEKLLVENRPVITQLTTTGEIQADENRIFHINSFASGRITQEFASLGMPVRAGQTLAIIENTEVAKIQADYIHQLHQNEIDITLAKTKLTLAKRTLAREQQLLYEGISPRKDYDQAQAEVSLAHTTLAGLQEHRLHLRNETNALLKAYGISVSRTAESHHTAIQNTAPIRSPRAGVILKKTSTVGDVIMPDTVLFEVGDLSIVWLNSSIYSQDFPSITQGQQVSFTTDSLPNQRFTGRIDYIPPVANTNQPFMVRTFLKNTNGLLQPGMFGQVTIAQPHSANSQQAKPFIPTRAVQQYGKESFVFIPTSATTFRKQRITLGLQTTQGYWVETGLSPKDTIIGNGSYLLKAELLKTQFADTGE
jgi:cobalt-zinc-cadmium efflux system membrane fusion protein